MHLEGAEQGAAPRVHQISDPEQAAAQAGAQHQPRRDQPAAAQGAAAAAAAGPVRLPGRPGTVVQPRALGRRRLPRHGRNHHHHGQRARPPGARGRLPSLLLLPIHAQDDAEQGGEGIPVGVPAARGCSQHGVHPGAAPHTALQGRHRAHSLAQDRPGLPRGAMAEHRLQVHPPQLVPAPRDQLGSGDQGGGRAGQRPRHHGAGTRRGGTATLPGGEGDRAVPALPEEHRPRLRRVVQRVALLPLPPHRGLRGLRLGLDHRPQALQGELLLGPVRVHVPPEVPAHAPRAAGEPAWLRGALLHPDQDVAHQHAVLQRPAADHLRQDPRHGGGQVRVLLRGLAGGVRPTTASTTTASTATAATAATTTATTSSLFPSRHLDRLPLGSHLLSFLFCGVGGGGGRREDRSSVGTTTKSVFF